MNNNDTDVIAFFSYSFERILLKRDVPREDWPSNLPSKLNLKCGKVLSGSSLDQNRNYHCCKKAILDYFRFDEHGYLKTFRTMTKASDS